MIYVYSRFGVLLELSSDRDFYMTAGSSRRSSGIIISSSSCIIIISIIIIISSSNTNNDHDKPTNDIPTGRQNLPLSFPVLLRIGHPPHYYYYY